MAERAVRSALKRTQVQDFSSLFIMIYYIISTTYKELKTYFALFIFLVFRIVWREALDSVYIMVKASQITEPRWAQIGSGRLWL